MCTNGSDRHAESCCLLGRAQPGQAAVSKVDASKVWALAASTQDDDLLDDDELLTEEDQRPPTVPGTLQSETRGPEDTGGSAGLCQVHLLTCGFWALAAERAGPEAARAARRLTSVGVSVTFR